MYDLSANDVIHWKLKMAPRLIKSVYATDLQKILRKLLFDFLEKEDDYIQIPYMIIQKVGT